MVSVNGRRCFISGPMSGIELNNAPAFVEAHAMLKEIGAAEVFDPVVQWLSETGETRSHAYYMRVCLNSLLNGRWDILVSLPGWEESRGARLEREVAEACGIKVCDISEVGP